MWVVSDVEGLIDPAVDVVHPVVDLTAVDLTVVDAVAAVAADPVDAVDDYDAAAVVVVVWLMWAQGKERALVDVLSLPR